MEDAEKKLKNLRKYVDSSKPAKRDIPRNVRQLCPSEDAREIKYFNRINKEIKAKFREYQEITCILPLGEKGPTGNGVQVGNEWHGILKEYINGESEEEENKIGKAVIDALEDKFDGIEFLESEFPLYGYMVDKEDSEIYFWNGKADAIGWYEDNYVIVDWKAVDVLDFWRKDKRAYGDYLHQCLVYARLLQLHLELDELPYILIVPINNQTGNQIHPGMFYSFPDECEDELDKYKWSKTGKAGRKILRLPKELAVRRINGWVEKDMLVHRLFKYNCTVKQMLNAFGFDELEVK